MKTRNILFFALFISGTALAQQDIQFSQTLFNPYVFNPAAAGLTNLTEMNIGMRTQWLAVEGKPQTYYANVQSQIRFKKAKGAVLDEFNREGRSFYDSPQRTIGRKHILGGKFVSDVIGPFNKTSAMGSYAIHLPLTQKLNAGVGIGLGWSNFAINQERVSLIESNDAAYQQYLATANNQNLIDVQTGLVLYNDRFLFSLSGSQFLKNKMRFDGVETESAFERHLYALASYRFDLSSTYAIEPLVILKNTTASPLSFDAGARFHYQRIGWLSLSYRSKSTVCAGIGLNLLKNFRLAYAFEFGVSGTRSFGAGAHELHLGFVLGRRRNMDKEFKQQEKEHQQQDDELQPGTM